jgi:dipeptidyl aminopeptidase/acylaminoacyl peptidase
LNAAFPRRWLSVAAVLAGLLGACRGDPDPFESKDRLPFVEGQQTFSARDDRLPAWSEDGQQIYYSAEGFGDLSTSPGVLLGLPLQTGMAEPVFPNVQSPGVRGSRWLMAPTPAAGGQRLAFVEIEALWNAHPCDLGLTVLVCEPERSPAEAERPPLMQIAIRVRRFDASGPLEEDPTLVIKVPGVIHEGAGLPTDYVNDYPFQQLFARERAFTLRVSWAPDGERLALSDGLNVLVWRVGDPAADTVPNTQDAAWPAWSPDGQLIAFTRLERADSANVSCDYVGAFGVVCTQIRTEYTAGRHVISVVRPDGSGLTELGEGDEPAWAPDGRAIYFHRDGQIWRMAPDGSDAEPIAGTTGGREPSISPDGTLLAFSRLNGRGDYDIWVTRVEP